MSWLSTRPLQSGVSSLNPSSAAHWLGTLPSDEISESSVSSAVKGGAHLLADRWTEGFAENMY